MPRAVFNERWPNQTWFNAPPLEFSQGTSGSVATAGALAKGTSKTKLSGTLTSSGGLLKRTYKILAATLQAAGVLLNNQVTTIYYRAFSGGITPAGAVLKQTSRYFAGTLTSSGAVLKTTKKYLAGALSTVTGALTVIPLTGSYYFVSLVGAITPTGALTKVQTFAKVLTASLTPTGILVRNIWKTFAGSITPEGSLTGPVGQVLRMPFKVVVTLYRTVVGFSTRHTKADPDRKDTKGVI